MGDRWETDSLLDAVENLWLDAPGCEQAPVCGLFQSSGFCLFRSHDLCIGTVVLEKLCL